MVFLQCNFRSSTLKTGTGVNVLLPDDPPPAQGWPVLWLLHGLGDDHSTWMRRTGLERYVRERRLAVIMPAVQRSFYTDQVNGFPYFQYIAEELRERCGGWFPISAQREDNFVAGLSMGGYGAFKLALRQPERFAAAASMSGALLIESLTTRTDQDELRVEFANTFGDLKDPRPEDDLIQLLQAHRDRGTTLPRLLQICGTEDYLYPVNTLFRDKVAELGAEIDYRESPGAHDWDYWDAELPSVLDWMGLKEAEG